MASSLFARFAALYFAHLAPDDAKEREPDDLEGAAKAHLRLADVREPGEPVVRVYTPTFDQDGYDSTHTIVDIVTDDMPFLVDSVSMELTRHGLGIHLVVHPIIGVQRDKSGHLVDLDGNGPREAFMHFEVDRETDAALTAVLRSDLLRVLADVRHAVDDWDAMRARASETAASLDGPDDAEPAALLRWMVDGHFTFLGYRDTADPGTELGILRGKVDGNEHSEHVGLTVRKADERATVHRPVHMEQVCVGSEQFVGLWTAAAYNTSPLEIPLLRRKVGAVLERSGFGAESHAGKNLASILETYPRDELFQIGEDELYATATGILSLQERRRVRLFVRKDDVGRFCSCLVFLPRDRFTTELARRVESILLDALGGVGVESTARVSESVLARLHVIVTLPEGASTPTPDVPAIEARLADAARSWTDDLADELLEDNGEERGMDLLRKFGDAFPAAYREDVDPRAAVGDIQRIEALVGSATASGLSSVLTRPPDAPRGVVRMKLFRVGEPMALSDVLPLLEHLGVRVVDERPYEVHPASGPPMWIYDIGLSSGDLESLDGDAGRSEFCEAFGRLWRGEAESDGFNRLVLRARLPSPKVTILRAYAKYLRQIGSTFSQSYIEDTLAGNAAIARTLVELFEARFDPDAQDSSAERQEVLAAQVVAALRDVASLDEDRILSSFLHLIQATLRTSFYQRDPTGGMKPYMSFKLDPTLVPDLPLPRPMFEVWVYSPRAEGVHLRGGRIARGGIRWSDRREDFRTEILGLMKAQMVKNAVIVPVGAKGGFVVKRPPASSDRDALQSEVEACYQILIRGLLDITDNIVDGKVVPPTRVVRYDDDDPYLVVAADKGTATFSDLANSISAEYSFWLGDAFASGGSAGYDHKEMGITARGAWESVRRHFLGLGIDPDKDRFTVVGIGDMSGDVFGNAMLLSPTIELVGVFDHRHVFLDPKPDPAASFAERRRLFEVPRSSWDDFDRSVISAGGGVWPRTAKSIPLSDEARELLCTEATALTPAEVISALLEAPVDLLFNGGIGTYVKASTESNAEVGDRANDALRVNGSGLRCRAVVEGGNLGLTQRGRVEYAIAGGLVNTDAIDNSAGVDTSDHEVNIKILLDGSVSAGDLTVKQRNALLDEMSDEVAHLVLRNNYEQNRALANARAQAESMIDVHARYIRSLEAEDLIDRTLEFLPTERQLAERQASGVGLTTPEFAVLLAYTKTTNVREILASDLPDDPFVADEIARYFPTPLRDRFRAEMDGHRLRREIVAMRIVNTTVNKAGISFDFRMTEETGATVVDSTRAHIAARAIFAMDELWAPVEALDGVVSPDVQLRMVLAVRHMVERGALWLLRHRRPPLDISATVAAFAQGARELSEAIPRVLFGSDRERLEATAADFEAAGTSHELAWRAAALDAQLSAMDIIEVARARGVSVTEAAAVVFAIVDRLGIDWLRERVLGLARDNEWQTLARAALRDDLLAEQRELTAEVLRLRAEDEPAYPLVDRWIGRSAQQVDRFQQVLAGIRAGGTFDLTTLSVAVRELRNLITTAQPAG